MTYRELYGGLIRLRLLHHAALRPIYGLSMIDELCRHGYRLSPGTLYPILHRLEKKGYLRSTERRLGHTVRRMYRITPSGRRTLEGAKCTVYDLIGEMLFDGRKP
jgi:DNA-binding PadR family transcriptional regulator